MGYTFINYASQDSALAKRLVSDLSAVGVGTWIDADNLSAGTNFANSLVDAVKNADAMIIVVSKHSVRSQWVISELGWAAKFGVMMIPFVVDDADTHVIMGYMTAFQIIDARKNYNLALKALVAIMPESAKQGYKPTRQGAGAAKGYVFLSYANEDAGFVDKLKGYLNSRGYAYWDYRETNRDYQSLLNVELERAIKSSKATICMLSDHWKLSEWTMNEFEYSRQIGKPTLLLKTQQFEPIARIATHTYIDFTLRFDQGASLLDQALVSYGLL